MLRFLFLLLFFAEAACGQSLGIKPDLITAMPWTDSPDGVKVAAPFLLNPTTIVPAGSIIRLFYVRPSIEDGEQKPRIFDADDGRSSSASRMGTGIQPAPAGGNDPDPIPKALKKTLQAAHETVWPNLASFRSALDAMAGADLRIVYKTPGAKEISDEPFTTVEGLLLSEKPDGIYVQAVQDQSDVAQAGITPGDKIALFNGKPVPSLGTFLDLYRTASENGSLHRQKPYLFSLERPGVEKPINIAIDPPIPLGGSLIDQ